jgi:hypothetical protein
MIAREFKDLDLRLTWKPFGALPYHVFGFQDCSVQAVMRTRVLHLYLQLTNNFIITENLLILEFLKMKKKDKDMTIADHLRNFDFYKDLPNELKEPSVSGATGNPRCLIL